MPERKLPSGKIVEFVGLKGHQERRLLNDVQAKRPSAFDEVMRACVKSADGVAVESMDAILDLHSADRLALLIMLREETYGSKVEITWDCSKCKGKGHACAELSDLELEVPPNLDVGPVELPKSKKQATWDPPTGTTEMRFAKLRRGAVTIDLTHMMISRKVALDGKLASERELDDLEGMDRQVILDRIRRIGGPDSVVEMTCESCGASHRTRFEMLPDFFFPVAGRQ